MHFISQEHWNLVNNLRKPNGSSRWSYTFLKDNELSSKCSLLTSKHKRLIFALKICLLITLIIHYHKVIRLNQFCCFSPFFRLQFCKQTCTGYYFCMFVCYFFVCNSQVVGECTKTSAMVRIFLILINLLFQCLKNKNICFCSNSWEDVVRIFLFCLSWYEISEAVH